MSQVVTQFELAGYLILDPDPARWTEEQVARVREALRQLDHVSVRRDLY